VSNSTRVCLYDAPRSDGRFEDFTIRRDRFERTLTPTSSLLSPILAAAPHAEQRDRHIRQVINEESDGTITKAEDAVVDPIQRCP
jgi:hypothetical protein